MDSNSLRDELPTKRQRKDKTIRTKEIKKVLVFVKILDSRKHTIYNILKLKMKLKWCLHKKEL